MKASFYPIAVACLLAVAFAAWAETTFPARMSLRLCPEFPRGGVTVEVKYRVPPSNELISPTVTSQTLSAESNTGTFDLVLPGTHGAAPIEVIAFCRNAFGVSTPSNTATISYCSALALRDTDGDGLNDAHEDLDCDETFSAGDSSNFLLADTDGDGASDGAENEAHTDPLAATSSARPSIFSGAPFDPDGDGASNPLAWRSGEWHIKPPPAGDAIAVVNLGQPGDMPFVFNPRGRSSDVGVIRREGTALVWYFHEPGFVRADDTRITRLEFGIAGDRIVLGPWQESGATNPAVARWTPTGWSFLIYRFDGTVQTTSFGIAQDLPRVQDYDRDRLFDIGVFRPATGAVHFLGSASGSPGSYAFGSAERLPVYGDFTGDGREDITFFDPASGLFSTMTSDNGFDAQQAGVHNPAYYKELPLSGGSTIGRFLMGGRDLYMTVDHANGLRWYRPNNDPAAEPVYIQWGTAGDHLN